MAPKSTNEGEGNRTAARTYDRATTAFSKSGRVRKSADDALKAVQGPEKADLDAAEKAGRDRSKAEDPLLYKRKSK